MTFSNELDRLTEAIEKETAYVKSLGRDGLIQVIFRVLMFAALSTKHPGFKEEREWRAIYAPRFLPSKVPIKTIECIGGVPQTVYRLPLRNIPDEGVAGLDLSELINHVIIGPAKYPAAMKKAFIQLLTDAGVQEAERKVVVCNLPLRT